MSQSSTHVPDALASASNETLRATAAGLVAGEPSSRLLGRLLSEAEVSDARVGVMFAMDRGSGRPRAEAIVQDGDVLGPDELPELAARPCCVRAGVA